MELKIVVVVVVAKAVLVTGVVDIAGGPILGFGSNVGKIGGSTMTFVGLEVTSLIGEVKEDDEVLVIAGASCFELDLSGAGTTGLEIKTGVFSWDGGVGKGLSGAPWRFVEVELSELFC